MAAVKTEEQVVRAEAKYVRLSARKARVVLEHIRGRSVPEARTILAFTQRAAAHDIEKVLRSAVANAETNPLLHWNGDDLVIKAAYADEGPTLKRWRARARGRVNRIRKRTCHITIELAQNPKADTASRVVAQAAPATHRGPGVRRDALLRSRSAQSPREEEGGGRLMGQKVHPGGLRVGVIHDWKSNWYVGKKEFPQYILEDVQIREHINGKLGHAGLSDILIRKDKQRITVDIFTARPGIVIGKSGVEVDALRKELHSITGKNVHININEIKRPELDAKLVAQSIAEQLQNRVSFRRAMKRSLASAMRSGAQGIKIQCGGRLGGGEMSRSERYTEGRVPLHTIRADIDYGFAEAKTTYGRIGVKVWINKGEIMPEGYEGMTTGKDTRLGDQDQARRRRGGAAEGLGASRESSRDRSQDREGLGLVKKSRRPGGRPGAAGWQARRSGRRPSAARVRHQPPAPSGHRRAASHRGERRSRRMLGADRRSNRRSRRPRQAVAEAPETDHARAAGRRHDHDRRRGQGRRQLDAAPEEDQVPQRAPRSPSRPDARARARCSSATTGSSRSRPAGSPTGRSRRPGSR